MNSTKRINIVRTSLLLATLAGLAVGGLNIIKVKAHIRELQVGLREQTVARQMAETELAVTKRELGRTAADLKQTKSALEGVTAQKDQAMASAAAERKRSEELGRELIGVRYARDEAQAELSSYRSPGLTPKQIAELGRRFKTLQDELQKAQTTIKELRIEIANLQPTGEGCPVLLPSNLDGTVLVSDPKWHFVVLSAGEKQGVRTKGELLVSRGGKLVAKVVITRVEENQSIATVVPGWGVGEIAEGDKVIAAHPRS